MIKSMTGFGRACSEGERINFTVEIKSVNHRYLDFNLKNPKSISILEEKIRNYIKQKINRGKVDLFISLNTSKDSSEKAVLNMGLAQSYYESLLKIKDNFQLKDDISVSLIAKYPDVITIEQQELDEEEIWEELIKVLDKALYLFLNMRELEGEKLKKDIILKCDYINNVVDDIKDKSKDIILHYKDKLEERLKILLKDSNIDEGRIAMEVALFADKASVDEEIVRLKSHLSQMKMTLDLQEPIGRKLDFIVQEMNRETNTIASKSTDLYITNCALNIKNEIEKIREQIQNIE